MEEIINSPQSYELDPRHVVKNQKKTLKNNRFKVAETVQRALNVVIAETSSMPVAFRMLCRHVHATAIPTIAGMHYRAVTSFLFLRLLCAAIASPYEFGVYQGKRPLGDAGRALIAVSKLLQSVVNGRPFGPNSDLVEFNQLVEGNRQAIVDLVDTIVAIPNLREIEASSTLMENISVTLVERRRACDVIREHVNDNYDVISAHLRQQLQPDDPSVTTQAHNKVLDRPAQKYLANLLQAVLVRRVLHKRARNLQTNPAVLQRRNSQITLRKVKKKSWTRRLSFSQKKDNQYSSFELLNTL